MVDYLSTLNKNGSGLNLTELASSLVAAEVAPKVNAAEKRITAAETSISAYDQIRSQFEKLSSALSEIGSATVLSATSGDTAVGVTVTNRKAVTEGTTGIYVQEIAKRQVLEFTGFTDPTQEVGTGTITIEYGAWYGDTDFAANPDQPTNTLTIGAGATLTELADALSQLDGVTARVLDKGDGTYTLGVVSEVGAGNALRLTVAETGAGLSTFDNTLTNTTLQVQAASNAMLSVDGVTVFRDSNTIDDLIEGVTLTLNAPTEYETPITVARNSEVAYEMLNAFVNQVNETLTLLDTLTSAGINGGTTGDLSGDRLGRSLRDKISSLMTKPLEGHRDSAIYLSDLGVTTTRAGKMSLSEVNFDRAWAADPQAFDALFQNSYGSGTEGIAVSGAVGSAADSGTYEFKYDEATNTATLNGTAMFGTGELNGRRQFFAISGDLSGIVMSVEIGVNEGNVTFGRSLLSYLEDALTEATQFSGTLDQKERELTAAITEQEEAMVALDEKATKLEERYIAKFAAMEQIVTELKNTGDYLTNLVDSWNSD